MKKYKVYIIGGAIFAAASFVFYGMYKLFSSHQITLNLWLEKYAKFIEEKFKDNDHKLNLEIVAFMVNFISELEDYVFKQENPDLEAERINNLGNPNKIVYEELLFKTMEGQDRAFHEALVFVERKFGVSMSDFNVLISESGNEAWKNAGIKSKYPYQKSDLPSISREELKKGYLEFSNGLIKNAKEIAVEIELNQSQPNNQEYLMMNVYNIKYRFKDGLRSKYGFDEKYFDTLIDNDEVLSNDQEIHDVREKVKTCNPLKNSSWIPINTNEINTPNNV